MNNKVLQAHIDDDVTVNAKVIAISESGNPIVQTKSGIRVLIKPSDINTIRPATSWDGVDKRKGE